MKHLSFYFDVVSPYAYLAFERLPEELQGLSIEVRYRPVLLAAMLKQWGQKGPAEIAPKRDWTYRHAAWLAHRHGIPMQMPAQHPFNPLAVLRLALACVPAGGTPSRWVCEQVLRHVWRGGAEAGDPARLQALGPLRDPAGDEVKEELRSTTDEAVAQGLFGVPSVEVDGRLFWGLDGLALLSAYLRGDPWFDGPAWDAAGRHPAGTVST